MYDPFENQTNQTNNDALNQNTNPTQESNSQASETTAYEATAHQEDSSTGTVYSSSTQQTNPYQGNAPQGTQTPYPTQTGWQYGNQQNQGQNQAQSGYTWNGATQHTAPYYTPVQPKPKKKLNGKKAKRIGLRVVAAVLCCAVISFVSVGAFALMIQTGLVNVESTGNGKTAAFTLYKLDDSSKDTSSVVTGDSLSRQEVAQKIIPSVVCIQNYQISQQGLMFGYSDTGDSEVSPAGEGSGIIISDDGYIVTNQHVIDGATSLKVITSDGLTYEATLVGEDTQTDLAVIKIDADGLTAAEFGSSSDLQVADEVMAVGNPGGMQLNSSVTLGYVSALNRPITNSETGYTINCIQTDAAINPGNSGGALVDMNGYVVGINSSKIAATDYEGLGFAIPSDTVQPIVSDLIEYGYVKDRPMLGISGQYIDQMTASFYGLTSGFYVTEVTSDAATHSGLQRGDVITAIDDTQVTSANTISTYIADKKPGDTVTLTVYRSSNQKSIQVELTLSENTGSSVNSSN